MEEIEEVRRKLWCDIAVAYVNSSGARNKEFAATWADRVMEDFDKRFNK